MVEIVSVNELLGLRAIGVVSYQSNAYGAFWYRIGILKKTGALAWQKCSDSGLLPVPMSRGRIGAGGKKEITVEYCHYDRSKAHGFTEIWAKENGFPYNSYVAHNAPIRAKDLYQLGFPMTEEMYLELVRQRLAGR